MVGRTAGFAVALVLGCAIEISHQARAERFLEQNADGTDSIDSFHWYTRGVYLP
jgi:hypothetical protein